MTTQEQLEAILEPWLDEVRSEYGNGSHDSRKPQFKAIEEAKQAITALIQEAVNEGRREGGIAELKKLRSQDRYTNRDSYALWRIDQLKDGGGSNND